MKTVQELFAEGNALYSSGNHKEAIECYDKALELNPNYAGALYNKGVALNTLGKHNEAIDCYDKALELNPHLSAKVDDSIINQVIEQQDPELLLGLVMSVDNSMEL